ncbi:MAG: ABC transporter substrate binding protein [Desulfobacterium sp.]
MLNKTLSLLMIGMCLFLPLSDQVYAKDVRTVKILVLNSYHKGLPWTDNFVNGIESVLIREKVDADLVIEYMDSKAVKYDKTYKTMLYKLYSHKYGYQKFDVIISSDDNAFNFLREYHKAIFPDTPIVFGGVNNLEAPTTISRDYFTGILEIASRKETLNLALKLHPETKQVVIVTDTTPSGNYSWRQFEPLFIRYPDITFTRIDDRSSISEIEDRMKKLSDDTIAIFTSLYRDKTGRNISLSEGTSRISMSSRRPIYSFYTQVLQHGTIGGKLLGGQHHGKKSAEMAILILQGEKVSNIPIVDQSVAQYIFDYQQLERFGIKSSDLPEESYITNEPASFYKKNKQGLWITSGAFIFLVTVALILVLNIMRSRKAEQERLEREKKLRLLFDHSPVGICTVDLSGNFITTNPAYEQMLGYSKEELQQLSFFNVTHSDYRQKNKPLFQNMFSVESTGFKIEKIYIRKDGDEIDVSVHAIAIMDDKGKTKFGTAFVEDITERKQAEEALVENELRLNEAQRLASIGSWMHNVRSNKLIWSDETFRILGIDKGFSGELFGAFLSSIHPEDKDAVIKAYKDSIKTKKPYAITHKLLMPDGRVKYVHECCKTEYDESGNPVKSIGTIQDITERKKAEKEQEKLQAQLIQAQKMESVGRLAGGVAHDFNNMLSIIIGYSESALEVVRPDDPLYEEITEILNAGMRSAGITRQLLAFARQQTAVPEVLDLNDSLDGLLKMLRRLIGEDIDLAWQPGANVWPVKIDPSQIDQILANLCVNARDAIADVGQVTIETKNSRFDEEYCTDHAGFIPGEYVMLAVSDSGRGMAPDVLEKIFEPFFTTKGLHQGTGLGLSTVYGIVKQNTGFINVYSEIEKGTTIKIYLSRYTGQGEVERLKSSQEILLSHGETILMVEDDKSILKLGERMLNSLGYTVLSAATPGEAIKLVEESMGKINLLLTDIVMPEMNGRELSERLTKQDPDLKTLYMSGYTANVIVHRGVLEEGVCFIPKPLSKKELSIKVRDTLDNVND